MALHLLKTTIKNLQYTLKKTIVSDYKKIIVSIIVTETKNSKKNVIVI